MLFNSIDFLAFFPIVVLIYLVFHLIKKKKTSLLGLEMVQIPL